uniref:Reverse transcriptase Ty1/copia-type domain-containing protein n=1 Tax=Solanum lycopersicum TaxID=4081 RepID=A0A3Q7HR29_SOLLC
MAVCSSANGADTPFADITHFRSLIGALQYLAITRPDIQFAVNRVAQRMHQPSTFLALLVVVYSFDPGTWSFGVSQIQIGRMI